MRLPNEQTLQEVPWKDERSIEVHLEIFGGGATSKRRGLNEKDILNELEKSSVYDKPKKAKGQFVKYQFINEDCLVEPCWIKDINYSSKIDDKEIVQKSKKIRKSRKAVNEKKLNDDYKDIVNGDKSASVEESTQCIDALPLAHESLLSAEHGNHSINEGNENCDISLNEVENHDDPIIEQEHPCNEPENNEMTPDDGIWIEKLRQDKLKGIFDNITAHDRKIGFLLDQPVLSPEEIRILHNLYDLKLKYEKSFPSYEAAKVELDNRLENLKNDQIGVRKRKKMSKIERNLRRKKSAVDVKHTGVETRSKTIDAQFNNYEYSDSECTVGLTGGGCNSTVSVNEDLHITEIDVEVTGRVNAESVPVIQTPQFCRKRRSLLSKFDLCSPSPMKKYSLMSEELVKRVSLAAHLHALAVYGDVKFLQSNMLTDSHFEAILSFTGPDSKWRILPEVSVKQLKDLWTAKSFYCSKESGYESLERLHTCAESFCPFGHCSAGILDSFLSDLYQLSPVAQKERPTKIVRKSMVRKLSYDDDKSKETKRSTCEAGSPSKDVLLKLDEEVKRDAKILQDLKMKRSNEQLVFPKKLFSCLVEDCERTFASAFALGYHLKHFHSGDDRDGKLQKLPCPYCYKNVKYISQHIRRAHKEVKRFCDVCQTQREVYENMKDHRSGCIKCRYCPYTNKKLQVLLGHIDKCPYKDLGSIPLNLENNVLQSDGISPPQEQPLDLSTPKKNNIDIESRDCTDAVVESSHEESEIQIVNVCSKGKGDIENENDSEACSYFLVEDCSVQSLNKKRNRFSFDSEEFSENEYYVSEYEDFDDEEFTHERRLIKDSLEQDLRNIDQLQTLNYDSVVLKFKEYLRNKKRNPEYEGPFAEKLEASTIETYPSILKKDLFPAMSRLIKPFSPEWTLDCIKPKCFKVDGIERACDPKLPVFMSPRILDEALNKFDPKISATGNQRTQILSTTENFMEFVEMFFIANTNLFSSNPHDEAKKQHDLVRTYITGKGYWKKFKQAKKQSRLKNKAIQEYENPFREHEIFARRKQYISSKERKANIERFVKLTLSKDIPSDADFTYAGNFLMAEIIGSTGCRPNDIRKLPLGPYADKQPGFPLHEVSSGDEVSKAKKIMRRLNPNLPPSNRACIHQLENNSAECPVQCEDRCDPDGYNILVTWGKNFDKKGASYMHLTKPLKTLVDLYLILRQRKFQGHEMGEKLFDDMCPVFLNSAGAPFQSVNVDHISNAIGIDISSYNFRYLMSTWVQTHESEEIRNAESDALQHSIDVAKEHYLQSQQVNPQLVVSTFEKEESLFPEEVLKVVREAEDDNRSTVIAAENERKKKRYQALIEEKAKHKMLLDEFRPLGPKRRFFPKDINMFCKSIEQLSGKKLQVLLKMKPTLWRNVLVRSICSKSPVALTLRETWKSMYLGDGSWGIRDVRLKAKNEKWPSEGNQTYFKFKDRSSYIAFSLLKVLKRPVKKKSEKKRIDAMS